MGNRNQTQQNLEIQAVQQILQKEKQEVSISDNQKVTSGQLNIYFSEFKYLSQFLTIKEILIFSSTCSRLRSFCCAYQGFFAKRLYSGFMNKQLEFILELQFFEDENFQNRRNKENQTLLERTNNSIWYEHLREFTQLSKNRFNELIQIICSPMCPPPVLRRETVGIYSDSDYQGLLSTKLEAQQRCGFKAFDFQMPTYEIIQNFKENKQQILEEAFSVIPTEGVFSKFFLGFRWYNCMEEEINIKMFLTYFDALMKRYTGVLSDYFREQVSQVDAFTLLNEYVIYFEAFTNTLMEIDSNFSIVEDMINEVHEHLFPQYPQYPKFSFSRLMMNRWIKNIFFSDQNLGELLKEVVLVIINHLREKQLQTFFELEMLSHELKGTYFKFLTSVSQFNLTHTFFSKNDQEAYSLVYRYFRQAQDISLNEGIIVQIAIHWFGHSECEFEKPFSDLECAFLDQSRKYYKTLSQEIFKDDLSVYLKFLEIDQKLVQQISYETLQMKVLKIKQSIVDDLMSKQLNKQIRWFVMNNQLDSSKFFTENTMLQNSNLAFMNFNQVEEEKFENILSNNYQMEIQADPIDKIIKLCLQEQRVGLEELSSISTNNESMSQFNHLAESDKSDRFFNFPIEKLQRESLTRSEVDMQQSLEFNNYVVNEDLLTKIKSNLLESEYYNEIIRNHQHYQKQFEKIIVNGDQKDQELTSFNEEKQIPRQLTEGQRKFYYVSNAVSAESLEENKCEMLVEAVSEDEQMDEEKDLAELELKLPKLSRQFSKNDQVFEEYNSSDEEEEGQFS